MTKTAMQMLVLLRETCDPQPPARLTADGYGVRERGLRRIANPADLCALEMALQLTDRNNGTVTVVAIGPERLDDHLRLGHAMGADRALRVWNPAFQGGDAVSDARLVEQIVNILEPDLFFTGNRLLDRGGDPAPALASANLGRPYVTSALAIACSDGEVEVLRKSDRGARQRVRAMMPCTLLFEADSCEPRYPDQDALIRSLDMTIEVWDKAELGLCLSVLGAPGALLGKDKCSFPRVNPKRIVTPDANLPAFERILALLSGGIKPRQGNVHAVSTGQTVDMLYDIFEAEGLIGGGGA